MEERTKRPDIVKPAAEEEMGIEIQIPEETEKRKDLGAVLEQGAANWGPFWFQRARWRLRRP